MTRKNILAGILLTAFLAIGIPVFAKTALVPAATLECIGKAVAIRETALGYAVADYTRSTDIAYAERAANLSAVYAQTGATNTAIKASVKSAWTKFDVFMKSVKNKWSISRTAAWAKFKADARVCKVPAEIYDASNVSLEISGK